MPAEWLCWTDGACKPGDDAPGGWGFHARPPAGAPIERWGKALRTSSKAMEYRAVAEALAVVPAGAKATVFSDDRTLVENLTKRLAGWASSNYVNVDPLVVDSVRRIGEAVAQQRLEVRFQWLRAHAGNAGNERADALAAQGAREAKADAKRRPLE